MGVLVDGQWQTDPGFADRASGKFERQAARFRDRISADGSSGFPAEKGRYHLFVARACPWCHRTMLFRTLKGLEDVISLSAVEPTMLEQGWTFREPDPLTGARHVHELYQKADPGYSGRATVPVLWDRERRTIVSNESSDIVRMLCTEFSAFTDDRTDYRPAHLAAQIDAINERVYQTVNNGVYRAGFATTQSAYAEAARALFESLDWLEAILQQQRYLVGGQLSEADWRLFPTLIRFDAVYYAHFKCNLRHVYEYPALWGYTRELYQQPGIATTVDLDDYKAHYYGSLRQINPTGIAPLGPILDLDAPHGRDRARYASARSADHS
jgi:glutathionyl-hydroquinone reductase